jgi:hypothetical protein
MDKTVYTLEQAAEYLGISTSLLGIHVKRGEVIASHVGNGLEKKSLRFFRSSLDAFLHARELRISKPLPKSRASGGVRLGVLKLS